MKAMRWIMWTFAAVFFAALLVDAGIESSYYQNKPRIPNTAQAQVIPLTVMHGSKIYVDEREMVLYNDTQKWTRITMLVSFMILAPIKLFLFPDAPPKPNRSLT
jgi:hypothetical protein